MNINENTLEREYKELKTTIQNRFDNLCKCENTISNTALRFIEKFTSIPELTNLKLKYFDENIIKSELINKIANKKGEVNSNLQYTEILRDVFIDFTKDIDSDANKIFSLMKQQNKAYHLFIQQNNGYVLNSDFFAFKLSQKEPWDQWEWHDLIRYGIGGSSSKQTIESDNHFIKPYCDLQFLLQNNSAITYKESEERTKRFIVSFLMIMSIFYTDNNFRINDNKDITTQFILDMIFAENIQLFLNNYRPATEESTKIIYTTKENIITYQMLIFPLKYFMGVRIGTNKKGQYRIFNIKKNHKKTYNGHQKIYIKTKKIDNNIPLDNITRAPGIFGVYIIFIILYPYFKLQYEHDTTNL